MNKKEIINRLADVESTIRDYCRFMREGQWLDSSDADELEMKADELSEIIKWFE